MRKIRLEYSREQGCFHFEDINKDNKNTFSYFTIKKEVDSNIASEFVKMYDSKYPKRNISIQAMKDEFNNFINGR